MVTILPYIDQAPLFNQVDTNYGIHDDPRQTNPAATATPANPSNGWVAKQLIPVYKCPTDTSDQIMSGRANYGGSWAVNSYKGVAGGNWQWGSWQNRPSGTTFPTASTDRWRHNQGHGLDRGNGLLFRGNSWAYSNSFKNVTDGTSATFAIGEAVPKYCVHTWWWWFNGVTATCSIPLNAPAVCTSVNANNSDDQNLMACAGDWPNNYSFMSQHTGGGQFTLCDGSVRFISENIDLTVYRSLATIDGGETVGEF